MNLSEAKQKALSLMAEYSVDGVLTTGDNVDYLNRMNRFADMAQKEIAQIKRIHGVYSISQNPIRSQLGLLNGFQLIQHLNEDIIDEYKSTRSYYFEVDNVATVYIDELLNGTWTNIKTINNTVKGQFTAYKGNVIAVDPMSMIRIRYSGNYVYNIRNRAMFEYAFPTDADVPNYKPWVRYDLPDDFFELKNIMQSTETRQYNELTNYKWEGRKTFVVNYYDDGQFDINYFKYPKTITAATSDTYEFEVDTEAQEAIPFFLAAHSLLDENANLSVQLLNEYESKLQRLFTKDTPGVPSIINNYDVGLWW